MTDAAEPPTVQPNPADFPSAAAYLAARTQQPTAQPGDYPNPADYPIAISKQPTEQDSAAAYQARMEGYAKRTATAVVFLAWVTGVLVAISIIVGIVALVHINNANNAYNSVTNCQSLGGTNPNC